MPAGCRGAVNHCDWPTAVDCVESGEAVSEAPADVTANESAGTVGAEPGEAAAKESAGIADEESA
ncbi:MAG: hypothetical protein FWH55_10800 [Oscillospiraceae bacterium]|nr:hypothetical protein [Oscillospiraceae bacterium]